MHFRIGINVGDVMVQGADILGDGVNIAARLEQMAQPGSIFVSGSVWEQIEGKVAFPCWYFGEEKVKNIARPFRTYRVGWEQPETAGKAHLASNNTSCPPWPGPSIPILSGLPNGACRPRSSGRRLESFCNLWSTGAGMGKGAVGWPQKSRHW